MADATRSSAIASRRAEPSPDDVLLADEVVEPSGPQALRERRHVCEPFVGGVAEEVAHPASIARARERREPA